MSITQYSEDQLNVLKKGVEKVNELFSLLHLFEPILEASHAAMRFQEGFMWFEQIVKNGVRKMEEISSDKSSESPPVPSPVDETNN